MKHANTATQQMEYNIVGSTVFGRYPKISVEETFNMIMSDEWLVPYAGYKKVGELNGANQGAGRGIFTSTRANVMIAVSGQFVYLINKGINIGQIGSLSTTSGTVFIDENDTNQIAICDKKNIYIYNYITNDFEIADTPFTPGYVAFQDGRFIAPELSLTQGQPTWRLSEPGNGLIWPVDAESVGVFQTKPDAPLACIRFPGHGNQLFVMGKVLTESWFDAGAFPFPYVRSSSFNIDYGCLSAATIAFGESFVVWLGSNEKAGPTIMVSNGGETMHISTDGIDFKLASLTNPTNSYAFLFQQDGHWIYQFTFPDDNLTYAYDFNTKKFFTLTDENQNYHIAKRVCSFNNSYYFVSFNDGNLYELNTKYTNYDYGDEVFEIPRIRITNTIRLPDNSGFICSYTTFVMEQGNSENVGNVQLTLSRDGGVTYSNPVTEVMNPIGYRKNQFNYFKLGYANELTQQFRFYGFDRFVIGGKGMMGIYQ